MALLVFGSYIKWQISTSLCCSHAWALLNTRAGMKSSSQQWPLIKNAVFLYPSANSVWYLITYLDVWYLEQVGCPVADADWQSLSSQAQACSFYYRAQPHMERAAGKEIEISSCLSSAFLVKHINYSPCYFIKALWQKKPFSEAPCFRKWWMML